MRRFFAIVCFGLLVGCGGADGVAETEDTVVDYVPTSPPSTTKDPDVPEPSEVGAALKLAAETVPRQATVPDPWVECCPPLVYGPEKLAERECASPADLPPHVAGVMRQFGHDLRPNANESGHVTAAVRVARTPALAKREWSGVSSPEYRSCQAADERDKLASRYGFDVSADAIEQTYERTELDLTVPAFIDTMQPFVTDEDGSGAVLVYSARALVGRAIVRLEFTMLVPYEIGDVRAILEPTIVRLIAAQQ